MSVKKLIDVEDAVGMVLPHDMTEIVPGETKGPAFKKGHVVTSDDVEHLKCLGKNHIYVIEVSGDEMHEDDAAIAMAEAIAGPGVTFDPNPSEGKIAYKAGTDGLFRVDRERLLALNLLGDVMLATVHDNSMVKAGDTIAAGRAIPLVIDKAVVDKAVEISSGDGGLLRVVPRMINRGAIVVTGQEVYEGRIKDSFGPRMKKKLQDFGLEVLSVTLAPDDIQTISDEIKRAVDSGAELILCTGGMSVDPDDVTRAGIARAGATDIVYGSPVLPGAMFLVSSLGGIPVLGIPACGMFFRTTVLDLVLPRVLVGEKIGRRQIAELGHGGLCLGCKKCTYPTCPFGKG